MAKKTESTFINMLLTLLIVTGVAALALGGVYSATKDKIAEAKQNKITNALKDVLPEFDEESLKIYKIAAEGMAVESIFRKPGGADSLTFYEATKDGEMVGVAIKTFTDKGFTGRFWIMGGFLPDGSIVDVKVLEHYETPGLGDKMEKKKSNWSDQFKGKNPASWNMTVVKDGGEVDAITASTISSRAFCDAMQKAYDAYMKQKSNGGTK